MINIQLFKPPCLEQSSMVPKQFEPLNFDFSLNFYTVLSITFTLAHEVSKKYIFLVMFYTEVLKELYLSMLEWILLVLHLVLVGNLSRAQLFKANDIVS